MKNEIKYEDLSSVNLIRDRYPDMKIEYIVDNEKSIANTIEFVFDGLRYRVTPFINSDLKKLYEVIELGPIMDKVMGQYDSLILAIDTIIVAGAITRSIKGIKQ